MKRLLLLGLLALTVYTYHFKRRSLPVEVKSVLVEAIRNPVEIRMREWFVYPFNPAVVLTDRGYLVIFRSTTSGIWSFLKRYIAKVHEEKNFVVYLDREFQQLTPIRELVFPCNESGKEWSPEDIRLIQHNGEIYGFFNDSIRPVGKKSPGKRSMFMAKFVPRGDGLEVVDRLALEFRGDRVSEEIEVAVEKNWTPISFENEIYLLYTIDPFLVLRLNQETGLCEEVSRRDFDVGHLAFPRGGTPPLALQGGFLSFYHSRYSGSDDRMIKYPKRQCYYMSPFVFAKEPPFEVMASGEVAITAPGMYGKRKIIFPSALISSGEKTYLFWGVDDARMFVGEVDLPELERILKWGPL